MNKTKRLILLMATVFQYAHAGDVTSHTFFTVENEFRSGSPVKESLFGNERVGIREDGWHSAFQIVPFGGQSVKAERLARYFLPFGKSCLLVAEDGSPDAAIRDISARNLNIETLTDTFESRVCFAPQRSIGGVGLTWKQALWHDCDDQPKLWFELSFPIVQVTTNMNLCETIINDGGGVVDAIGLDNSPRVADAAEAFQQTNWNWGRILPCDAKKAGVADIELKLWYNTVLHPVCYSSWFLGVLIPTGNRPESRIVFEPIVGQNKHVGILYGSSIGFDDIWSCGRHHLDWALDTASRYLFSNHQTRSVDLVDKSFSRYIETYDSQAAALAAASTVNARSGTSGINVFTKKVKVTPRFSSDITTSLTYRYSHLVAEAGFNLFVRQAERVCPRCDEIPTAAIKYIGGLGDTTLSRTIRYDFPADIIPVASYAPLAASEYNYDSAAHPAVISHTGYVTLGYDYSECSFPMMFGVGGSYEFSHVNTALERWLVWGKFSVSF